MESNDTDFGEVLYREPIQSVAYGADHEGEGFALGGCGGCGGSGSGSGGCGGSGSGGCGSTPGLS